MADSDGMAPGRHLLPADRTRLHVRVRGRAAPWWLAAAYIAAIIPADFIMATGMLRGLRFRAEHTYTASAPARRAADPSWPVERSS